jgi:hypothetical protein
MFLTLYQQRRDGFVTRDVVLWNSSIKKLRRLRRVVGNELAQVGSLRSTLIRSLDLDVEWRGLTLACIIDRFGAVDSNTPDHHDSPILKG